MKKSLFVAKWLLKAFLFLSSYFSVFPGLLEGLNAQSPTISSFSPASGPVGTLVTISGTNLGNPTAFSIGGIGAIVVNNTGTTLVGMVMPEAITGNVSITTPGGTASGNSNFIVTPTPYPVAQQGTKLVGSGFIGSSEQGRCVSLSADGNTAIVGGWADNSNQGAAWVYTRIGGTWTQQGTKLVGTGNVGAAMQGSSVSLSADGNTAIVGGYRDNADQGAIWVFIRNGGIWTQQGPKVVGTGNVGAAWQGRSASLSADGNTVIMGGSKDNSDRGAAWVFTRNGGIWAQQGTKLVVSDATGASGLGRSISLSANGNTAVLGGFNDNSNQGAAWVFVRIGSTWTQQGTKLAGTGNIGAALQGISVSVSADGKTALVGGYLDNGNQGAAWVFTRNSDTWIQQGEKLLGTGNVFGALQGLSVSLSADGNSAIIGGFQDNGGQGAVWVFTRNDNLWTQKGTKLVGTGNTGAAWQGYFVSLSADGSTAIVGGASDNSNRGAAWVFVSPPPPPPPPAISSFSPASGPVGTLVTITGTNLGSTTAFSIGSIGAIVVSNSGTALVGMVMPGATTGPLTVTTGSGTANGGGNFIVTTASYPGVQQGAKLVGTGMNFGPAFQGFSVSVSADGNTAIVGGNGYNSGQGAAWVYVRNEGNWTQQGALLVGSGTNVNAQQGFSVSLSADGNTAIVGGPNDGSIFGAAWVFYRIGGVWTQQGNKLIGSGNTGGAQLGYSVSLSADGNTALVGGPGDNANQGATWMFIRNGSTWTQKGTKFVGTGNIGYARQGTSVSLSADAKTAIVGGSGDNSNQGATWVFNWDGFGWTQQGDKLVGIGNTGVARQGNSVSVSANGNTVLVGGYSDNSDEGAAWVFTRSGDSWTQQGTKLVGTGNIEAARQGSSVSLSADGKTAIVGGWADNALQGAAWVYTHSGGIWKQQGTKLLGSGNIGPAQQGRSVSVSADGSTAIVGGYSDNSEQGAAWVFISKPKIYYRSIKSGNWNDPNTWESSPVADFSSGVISPATISPGADAKGISIRQNHTVTVTQNVYVRQLFVHPSGVVNVIGCILTQIEN